jgi:G3E family GTPase
VDGTASQTGTPVTVLTGFLGSGKTTLLRRALTAPEFSDTAVVINEAGEIAIDHYLVDFVDGDVIELPGGCLCCMVREDLALTLRRLVERRDARDIRAFRRIVIETSGLADPAPILFTLATDPLLDQRLRLSRVVAVVDALAGAATLDRFAEAARQVAVADAIAVSKTDLAPFDAPLAARLDALNPTAERRLGVATTDPAVVLFDGSSPASRGRGTMRSMVEGVDAARPLRLAARATSPASGGGAHDGLHARHTHGIATFTVVFDGEVNRLQFARALGGLAQARGNDLLRVKGIVGFADRDGRPAVVQAAQHAMYAPEWLDDWPDADHRNRLVFIVHDIAPQEILDRFAFASPSLLGPPASRRHASGTPALPLDE